MALNGFHEKVYSIVEMIPYGMVMSYGQIAALAGNPKASREVGRAMRNCPGHLPWQRVVMADGSIAGGEHSEIRKAALEDEGIEFMPNGRIDMKKYGWKP